jgi:hypothetical protein
MTTSPFPGLLLVIGINVGVLTPAIAQSAAAPRLESSSIVVNAAAANVRAEGIQGGTTSSKSLFGKKKKNKTTPDMPAVVDVGVVDFRGGTVINGTDIRVNTVASGIDARGTTVRIGAVSTSPH